MRRKRTITTWELRGHKSENVGDMISDLPDAILTHILSFLEDTKLAVQTLSLSKRWATLWTSLASLYFHDSSFRKLSTFEHFISHVFTTRDNSISINKFVFVSKRTISCSFFEKLIVYAASNHVKNLQVCIKCIRFCFIPNSISTAVSLRTLKLKSIRNFSTKIESQFCFQHLKSLHLEGFIFQVPDNSDILFKCENLVKLSIVDCDFSPSDKLIISAPQLTRLSISFSSWEPTRFPEKLEVVLSSALLTELNFEGIKSTLLLRTNDEYCVLQTLRSSFHHQCRMDDGIRNLIIKKGLRKALALMNLVLLQPLKNPHDISLSMLTVEESTKDAEVISETERIEKGGLHIYKLEHKHNSQVHGIKTIFSPTLVSTQVYVLYYISRSDKLENPVEMHRRTILECVLHSDAAAPPST